MPAKLQSNNTMFLVKNQPTFLIVDAEQDETPLLKISLINTVVLYASSIYFISFLFPAHHRF